jgi:hypothetical protein
MAAARALPAVSVRLDARMGLPGIGFGQAGMRQRVVGRQHHRTLEQLDALVHLLLVADQVLAPLQVQAVSLGIGRGGPRELGFLLAAELAAQRLRDGGGNFAFQLLHLVATAAVLLTPQLR